MYGKELYCKLKLDYFYKNGWLYRYSKGNPFKSSRVGHLHKPSGYILVGIGGVKYYAHKLIYLYHHGLIPDDRVVDHINRKKSDNRIENLRLVTVRQNSRNAKIKSNNKHKVTGVSRDKRNKKWHAQIMVNGRNKGLGRYKIFENAVIARYHGEMKFGFTKQNPESSAYDYLMEKYGYIPSLDEIEDY